MLPDISGWRRKGYLNLILSLRQIRFYRIFPLSVHIIGRSDHLTVYADFGQCVQACAKEHDLVMRQQLFFHPEAAAVMIIVFHQGKRLCFIGSPIRVFHPLRL